MIHVVLPYHLRNLARVTGEVFLEIEDPATLAAVLDKLESAYPALKGTIRDQVTKERRPFLRFYACAEDLSHDPPTQLLPESVANGQEPLLIIGAIAGG